MGLVWGVCAAGIRTRQLRPCVAPLAGALLFALSPAAVAAPAASAASGPPASLVQYPLPNPDSEAWDIAAGPDGNMWAPYNFARTIARITATGAIHEFTVPSFLIFPVITAGADGNLWFLDLIKNNVNRMTPDGATITPFHFPSGNGGPNGIALGPDGNVWSTQFQAGYVERVTPAGAVSEFFTGGHPRDITGGPDGNVWFTDPTENTVARITPSGAITRFTAPASAEFSGPDMTAAGPDGNVWYTKPDLGVIGRVTPSGVFTEFYLPAGTRPEAIAKGPDGSLWFSDGQNNQIGRITTDGKVGAFALATPDGNPNHITPGPDGRLWFTMQSPARVGAFEPFVPVAASPDVRSIAPPDGTTAGGTKVLITGYDIGAATAVLFGDTPATSFQRIGPGQVEAVVPPHAAGAVDVTVITPSGATDPSQGSKFFFSSLECGKVITRSTTLRSDIGPCYRDGVIVTADDVALDLNRKRVYGFSGPSDGHAAGIRLPGRTGVTVKNGTVSGFDAGVVVRGGGSNTLTKLTVEDNIGPDDVFTTELGDGIFIEDSPGNKVAGNTLSHNGVFDGIGIFGPKANDNSVKNNVIETTVGTSDGGPAGQGIIINGATEGDTATHLESTRVANNVIRDNASAGIANVNHVRGAIVENTITGNGTTNSVGNGIGVSVGFVWDPAVPLQMLIEGNEVHGNGVDGIRIGDPRRGVRGRVSGNRILDNDASDNNANPAANTYEGSRRAFDLRDASPDCAGNTWLGNTWGSGGFTPACTTTAGSAPAATATSTAVTTAPSGPNAKAWERFINRGR